VSKLIDSHIHLDQYKDPDILELVEDSEIEALISVSFHLESCKKNLSLSNRYPKVKPAFGYHPEQPLPTDKELDVLVTWIRHHQSSMVAIGEVGLPYYRRKKGHVSNTQKGHYIELLETFVRLGKELDMPIVLHAVYEDAPLVCDLLEKYSFQKVHFHWFKGDRKTVSRMKKNGYFISVTPDITYEEEIQQLAQSYPIEQLMVETDGPWPFEGIFEGKMTQPSMMNESIKTIAGLKNQPVGDVFQAVNSNSKMFYTL
jgi:TatD DNase family protein